MRRNSVTLDPITKKFTQLDPPEKQPKVELTKEDKERVVKDFVEIMGRKPDQEEIEELFIEERKLKNNSGSNQRVG